MRRKDKIELDDYIYHGPSYNKYQFHHRLGNKMKTVSLIIVMLALVTVDGANAKSTRKEKRGVTLFGPPGYDVLGVLRTFNAPWAPAGYGTSDWGGPITSDLALGQIQTQATHDVAIQALRDPIPGTPSIAYPPDVVRAVYQAKQANHNVILAQHKVSEAKQAAILQQKIALAKEAAAREAAERSEAISAQAQGEARASAQQLVVLQQRLATLKDAVAASQRVAAARETAAAAAIQRSASETAAELRKQDVDKQIHQSEREAKVQDIVAAKQNAIASAVQNAVASKHAYQPWG